MRPVDGLPSVELRQPRRPQHGGPVPRVTILALLLALAGASAAAAQDSGRAYSLNVGYALGTGGASTAVAPVRLGVVEAGRSFPLYSGADWDVEYPVAVIPFLMVRRTPLVDGVFQDDRWVLDVDSPRGTSYGVGLKPVGIQVVRKFPGISFFTGVTSGFVVFDKPTPALNARKLNYLGEVEGGVRVRTGARTQLVAVYRWNHISNGGTAEINPGLDSHMLFVGFRIH